MSRTTVDIHILQTVPPSNINRDDTGSPKTAVYGGVRRARVSSQAWKRATRTAFSQVLDVSDRGVRTKKVVDLVADQIRAGAEEFAERADDMATSVLKAAGIDVSPPRVKKGQTAAGTPEAGYLLFLSAQQVGRLAELAVEAERSGVDTEKKAAKAAADSNHSVDVALFGRMVADSADLNVDAAVQVAHAISVHAADTEYDYFTAVDDRAPEDNTGAGMIGTVEFTSCTLYRYATVNVDGLHKTLGDAVATQRALEVFVRSFVTSMPTGKQNTFANRTLPDAVVVTVREGQAVNLVGAFEDAIVGRAGSPRLHQASTKLADYAQEIDRAYGVTSIATSVVRVGSATGPLSVLGVECSLDELISQMTSTVAARLAIPE